MIRELQPLDQSPALCSPDGIVPIANFVKVCDKFGVKFEDIGYTFPIPREFEDGSLLITLHGSQRHCVRFYELYNDHKLGIMDPDFNKNNKKEEFSIRDEKYLIENKCQFHKIYLKSCLQSKN
ncbi:MAG: hypothetical protein HQL19_00950 [Candidatus Omnitrophica bacterium]|nr:hypothetical protein [Candidatus Omnitrophota bacterium]